MKKLFCKLYTSYLLAASLTLAVILVTVPLLLQKVVYEQAEEQLAMQAGLFRRSLSEREFLNNDALRKLCTAFSMELGSRFTVISATGQVLAESEKNPAELDNHSDRPEIEAALQGKLGMSIRHSYTLDKDMLYVAVPLRKDGKIWAEARVSLPTATIRKRQAALRNSMLPATFPALFLAAAVSLLFTFRISRPLQEIAQGFLHFTQGRLNHRIRLFWGSPEIISLASFCNQMAAQLDEQTAALKKQLSLLESTFRSMNEAVLITDQEGRLLGGNQAAGQLFGFDPRAVGQRDIREIIRNADVQQFLGKTLKQVGTIEEVITVGRDRDKICSAHGCLLRDGSGRRTGALLVFHDITRLKRLEDLRRDFAANVSHELRTPITAISGFVETLRDGALHGPEAERFLEIIARNVKRLQAIIEDLLTLARLEQEGRQDRIALSSQAVKPVLQNAAAVCAKAAGEKGIRLELTCPDGLKAEINPALLEQAVVNLLDNAIKYSLAESRVLLRAAPDKDETVIEVQDFGCGISREHHARLFERFYRVDKARSCKLGGTGLGLAIVKHIVNAHHGTICVDSSQGRGSTFSIRLLC